MSIVLLKDLNSHIRDKFIRFQEKGHIYYIKREKGYKSVTTIVHNAFEKFNANKVIDNMMKSPKWPESKYYGMTKPEIKKQWKDNKFSLKLKLLCHRSSVHIFISTTLITFTNFHTNGEIFNYTLFS